MGFFFFGFKKQSLSLSLSFSLCDFGLSLCAESVCVFLSFWEQIFWLWGVFLSFSLSFSLKVGGYFGDFTEVRISSPDFKVLLKRCHVGRGCQEWGWKFWNTGILMDGWDFDFGIQRLLLQEIRSILCWWDPPVRGHGGPQWESGYFFTSTF